MKATSWLTVVVTGAAATAARAAEGGGEHHAEIKNMWGIGSEFAHAPALGFLSITFFVFAAGLFVILRPRISNLLESRAHTVKTAIEEAQRAKAAAEARAREAEQKLASLADDMARLRGEFEAQGRAEMARIEKLAEEAAARIGKDAEETIAAETARARQQLRAEAARVALELAEQTIKGALSGADDARLQKALVADLDADKKPHANA